MRLTILVLFIYAGTTALSQSATPGVPYNPQLKPPISNWQGTDFSAVPPLWNGSSINRLPIIMLPSPGPLRQLDRTQIDPQIIVHPPKSSLGTEPQGTLMAQNQDPGLQFLPIESSRTKLEKTPITWPKLTIQPIPIVWPNYKLLPIRNQAPATESTPVK